MVILKLVGGRRPDLASVDQSSISSVGILAKTRADGIYGRVHLLWRAAYRTSPARTPPNRSAIFNRG